jgi:hypothetical protein
MFAGIQQEALMQNESPPDAKALIYGLTRRADDLYAGVPDTVTAERIAQNKRRPGRPIFAVRVGL